MSQLLMSLMCGALLSVSIVDKTAIQLLPVFTLAAFSGKHNVTVWRPSVCLSVFLTVIERVVHSLLTRGKHTTRPAYISVCPSITRTGVVELLKKGHTVYEPGRSV